MNHQSYTPTPNIIFDHLLKELSFSELKILLIIIRQTNGWVNKKSKERKARDRITHSQFVLKTGLSRRVISNTINSLIAKQLIQATDTSGKNLKNPRNRKGRKYIFYSTSLNMCNQRQKHVQNMVHNKKNYNKRKINKERKCEFEYIQKEIKQIASQWNIN